jgi:hypothetical protein
LDTVKSLKHPDKKTYLTLTAAIFGVVIATGLIFVVFDRVFSEGYQLFYNAMNPEAL